MTGNRAKRGQGWRSSQQSGPTRWGSGKRRETEGTQSRFHPFGPRLSISKGGGQWATERKAHAGRAPDAGILHWPKAAGPAKRARGWDPRCYAAPATRGRGAGGAKEAAAIGARRSPSANGRRGRVGAGRKPHLKLCDASRLPLPLRRRSVSLPDPTVAARSYWILKTIPGFRIKNLFQSKP